MAGMSEADLEAHALEELADLSWQHLDASAVSPRTGERLSWDELILTRRLRAALDTINPGIPAPVLDEALAQLLDRRSQDALHENYRMHELLTRGVRVSYTDAEGTERNPTVWAIDFNDPYANEFLAVNQVRLADGKHTRRFDIVLLRQRSTLGIDRTGEGEP